MGVTLKPDKSTNKPHVIVIFAPAAPSMKILLIDNYDSFTWNLHQLLMQAGAEQIRVLPNDSPEITLESAEEAVVFSPGPGLPQEAGHMMELIRSGAGKVKMLGVCLGHQAIAEVFGARLIKAGAIYHGSATPLKILTNDRIFHGLPDGLSVGRYHSWIVDQASVPECLEVTATDPEGVIMALRHREFDITGVQFHPESVMTPQGKTIIRNWMLG
jgi:anthranilate synthase component II